MKDEKLTKCPICGKETLKRLIGSGGGLIFKGSGFYLTDYKNKPLGTSSTETNKTNETTSTNTEKTETKSEPSSTKKETKSEPTSTSENTTKKTDVKSTQDKTEK